MPWTDLNDLLAFLTVAKERSFTRAAAKLGVSQSALSQTLGGLEARLGLRLQTRTTRSVAPTEAGECLLRTVGPRLDEIEEELTALGELRDKPSGTIRLTTHEHAVRTVLWRALMQLLPDYPDIKVEIVVEYGLTDIVAGRYDAGVRAGEMVAKDTIAVRIGPDLRMAVIGAPPYFAQRPRPSTPQDLTAHACINLRLPTHGGLYAGEFAKDGRELRVRVEGQLVVNGTDLLLDAALAGLGLADLPADQVRAHLAGGRLVRVLADRRPSFQATTSTIQAVVSPRQPSPCWSTRCGIGVDDGNRGRWSRLPPAQPASGGRDSWRGFAQRNETGSTSTSTRPPRGTGTLASQVRNSG